MSKRDMLMRVHWVVECVETGEVFPPLTDVGRLGYHETTDFLLPHGQQNDEVDRAVQRVHRAVRRAEFDERKGDGKEMGYQACRLKRHKKSA